jgi:hypothetical protein
MHQYQFIFTEHQKKFVRNYQTFRTKPYNYFPFSFKAEDDRVEKRNKRWHVKYALKYCVTPEK